MSDSCEIAKKAPNKAICRALDALVCRARTPSPQCLGWLHTWGKMSHREAYSSTIPLSHGQSRNRAAWDHGVTRVIHGQSLPSKQSSGADPD